MTSHEKTGFIVKTTLYLEDRTLRQIDQLVTQGQFHNRSDALRCIVKGGLDSFGAGQSPRDKLRDLLTDVRGKKLSVDEALERAKEWL